MNWGVLSVDRIQQNGVSSTPRSKLSQTLASFFGREKNSDGWFLFLLCFDKSKGSNVC